MSICHKGLLRFGVLLHICIDGIPLLIALCPYFVSWFVLSETEGMADKYQTNAPSLFKEVSGFCCVRLGENAEIGWNRYSLKHIYISQTVEPLRKPLEIPKYWYPSFLPTIWLAFSWEPKTSRHREGLAVPQSCSTAALNYIEAAGWAEPGWHGWNRPGYKGDVYETGHQVARGGNFCLSTKKWGIAF